VYSACRHSGSQVSLTWLSSNKLISAVKSPTKCKDLSVRIWNTAIANNSYESRRAFDIAECSGWSPDASLVAFGSQQGIIRLCESVTGNCSRILDDHKSMISSLSFSFDGKLLASSSWDETIKVWNVGNDMCHRTLVGHTSIVQNVKWSPDGKMLASSAYDMTIRIWSTEIWDCLRVLQTKEALTTVFVWTYDSTQVVTGNEIGTIGVWNVAGDEACREIVGMHNRVQCLACSHDGQKVISAHGNVCVWRLATGELLFRFKKHDLRIFEVLWSKDDSQLLLRRRGGEGTVQVDALTVFDAQSGAFLKAIEKDDRIPDEFDQWEAAGIVRPRSFRRDPVGIACSKVSVFGNTACAMLESREIKFFTLMSCKQ
jgi:WD40 repeat protein